MKKFICLVLIVITVHTITFGREEPEQFTPGGRPMALIFTNFHTDFSDGSIQPAFDVTRAYIGYEYHFSREWYARIIFDAEDPEAGRHQFSAFLKNAYLEYSQERFTAWFGMIATTQFKVAENIWGFRYVEEVFQDLYSFNSSADLGVSLEYKFSDFISADFSLVNGEGYRKVQSDDILRPGAGISLTPASTVTARIYADYMGKEVKQQSLTTFMAYTGKDFIAAAEYNYQRNVEMMEGHHRYGPSFFATYMPSGSLKVFGRYDKLDSAILPGENLPWQVADDGQLVMAGVEYTPYGGIKFAPNFRWWQPADTATEPVYSIFLNVELRF